VLLFVFSRSIAENPPFYHCSFCSVYHLCLYSIEFWANYAKCTEYLQPRKTLLSARFEEVFLFLRGNIEMFVVLARMGLVFAASERL